MLIAIFVGFVVLGGYFACAESAFSSMNKIRMKNLAENGSRKAKNAMYIANNFDKALTTLLIAINITHIASASVATLYVSRKLGDAMNEGMTVIATFVTTGIVFLFSEMIPKSFANDRPDTASMFCAGSIKVMMKVLSLPVKFFSGIASFASTLFKQEASPSYTEDELIEIIDTAEEQGIMNEEQSDLLKSALDFDEICARDVMTMRDDIQYVEIGMSNSELIEKIKTIPHSRIPVCDGDLDNVVGILQIRKFLKAYINDKKVNVRSILLKPHFIESSENIDDLLDTMRQHKIYLAIVRNKENKVCGVVTIEDFLEELVGEIWDEEDVVEESFIKLGGNRFAVNPSLTLGDVFERIGINAPASIAHKSAQQVGVWVQERYRRLPEEDESFIIDNIEVTVEKVSETRVTEVTFHILDKEDIDKMNEADSEKSKKTGVSEA